MKSRMMVLFSLTLAVGLLFALVVTAQGPNGPGDPQRGERYPSPKSDRQSQEPGGAPRPTLRNTLQSRDATAPAVDPGEPGLSFRYVETFGVAEMAYFEDADHLDYPYGVGVDGAGNLWVAEINGARAMKYSGGGAFVMSIGTAGLIGRADDTHFYSPADVGIDDNGNVWVVDGSPARVAKYDSGGNYLTQLGVTWESGSDNNHFRQPRSIAFDSTGNIYVSDAGNHRIQVFDDSGIYLATIGESGVPGSDNAHFDVPRHIAIDGSDNLYVADANNHRVQIFDSSQTYVATLGVTGESGSDNSHFDWPMGVDVDATRIYVADYYNHRVQIFDLATGTYQATLGTGSPGTGNNEFSGPADVAVDTAGNLYVADQMNCRVQKFDSGLSYLHTFGTTGVPYLTDGSHYNEPYDVAVDAGGNVGIVENEGRGHRFVKLNANGDPQFAIGQAGVDGSDNAHFGSPRGVAFDVSGNVYVVDSWNNRVQIYGSDGTYQATLGIGEGNGNYQFDYPSGVAVDGSGNIYVADSNNHRVQIYSSSRVYVATLGTGWGTGNDQFDWPLDVYVDGSGNIYVAEGGNHRVQKFNSNRVWQMTLGTTGEWGDDFDHFDEPSGVTVDIAGNIYVADRYNNRVMVFDGVGAYLTTIGGDWGINSGQFNEPTGVDVDRTGNVYVADHHNHRVQKFTPGVPGWRQVNINGFGERSNSCTLALTPFETNLYASTYSWSGNGAQLWRQTTGGDWSFIVTDGFGNAENEGIDHLIEFNGQLYAGTWANDVNGGEVWRSSNGTNWVQVVSQGFGNPTNGEVFRFTVFDNQIYASTWSYTSTHGGEVWRSATGNSGDWNQVVSDGFDGDDNNVSAMSFGEFSGHLYAGTYNYGTGGEVWRTASGNPGTWTQVNSDGFGDDGNGAVSALAEFDGYLHAVTAHTLGAGSQVWRCQVCDGSDWEKTVDNGFGNANARTMPALEVFNGALYLVLGNMTTGVEVWRTTDGSTWEQVGFAGMGDSNNDYPYWDNSVAVFGNRFFVGTCNGANGGEVWQYLPYRVHLPIVQRNH